MQGFEPGDVRSDGDDRYECLGCGNRLERPTTPVECPECGAGVRNLNVPYRE